MLTIKRTDSTDPDFVSLVQLLDKELAVIDGSEHGFYDQYNQINTIRNAVVAYQDDVPVGCGAIKVFSDTETEVKRMYILPEQRGKGIAGKVLEALEKWAVELCFEKCILETGKRQPDAIHLYTKYGYCTIANYGQYIGVENSVCFEKKLLVAAPHPTS